MAGEVCTKTRVAAVNSMRNAIHTHYRSGAEDSRGHHIVHMPGALSLGARFGAVQTMETQFEWRMWARAYLTANILQWMCVTRGVPPHGNVHVIPYAIWFRKDFRSKYPR